MNPNSVSTVVSCVVPFLDLKGQYAALKGELLPLLEDCLEKAHYIDGASVRQFESAFASYCETSECVALDSGTAALHLSLLALDIGPGDEVIVPTNTFIATAAAVAMVGATVVPVDSDPSTWLMDLAQVEGKITPRTRAVIAVHLYGQPVKLGPLQTLCRARGLRLIEDAAQAQGARYNGNRIGGFSDVACFSFYPGKNLGAYGDAGAITTNDVSLAQRIRRLANHGRGASKYEHDEIGYNYRMDELQGIVLNLKLGYLDGWNDRRRQIAREYRDRLRAAPVRFYQPPEECESIYHLMSICCAKPRELAAFLSERGIDTGFHYPTPIHLQPSFRHLGYGEGDMPVAEKICRETISLPIFPEMIPEQVNHVCDSLEEFFD